MSALGKTTEGIISRLLRRQPRDRVYWSMASTLIKRAL
ncbi:hypothetical protein ABENE_10525 [Asticcacaulis benevestitus DSM 16100 = ATCC BAA-896]|uniref:Uncharacterized protein n=1 Tax=Asticcacaulis benevestitus DSM 16100 = ATCC BAA-896 TaxID=1121022 RepID=V4PVI6_9CAUL|nr:hypothetical protein ABENE_10525 [Asticcacaulis benevestitus DSM 16100 = ATCC BAA-896]